MTRASSLLTLLLVLAVLPATGLAAAARPPASRPIGPPPAIATFVDENTVLVAAVDLSAVDPDAFVNWAVALLRAGQVPAEDVDGVQFGLRALAPPARNWVRNVAKAGGRYLVVVASADPQTPPVVLMPIDGRSNVAALADLLKSPFGLPLPGSAATGGGRPAAPGVPPAAAAYAVDRIGPALVLGTPATLKKARDLSAKPNRAARPELAAGLSDDEGGSAGVRVAVAMTADLRDQIRQVGPTLPAELGGEPTAVLTDKLRSAALSIALPAAAAPPPPAGGTGPRAAVRLTLRGDDADTAGRLKNVLVALFRTAVNDGELAKHPDKDKVLKMLEPAVSGDRVRVELGQADLTASAFVLGPLAIKARAADGRVRSATNLKLIASAVRNATADAGGRPPRSLEEPAVLKYLGDTPAQAKAVLTHPLRPERGLGYTYVRPTIAPANPAAAVLVYESYDRWPAAGIQVALVGGTVADLKTEAELKDRLRASGGR